MSKESIGDRSELPLDVLDRIDQICDRFESAWARGERPVVEEWLEKVSTRYRDALRRDLLAAEIAARKRRGENPCPSCGAELPAGAPEGLCSRCLIAPGAEGLTTFAAADPTETDAGPDAEVAQNRIAGPVTDAAATDLEVNGAPDPAAPTVIDVDRGAASDLPQNTTIRYFGDYQVRKELGRGGMGVVYEARQVSLNRPVALKMIKAGVLADEAELRRFQNEAEAVALLDHPGVVPVYEVGDHDGQRYFSMKLVDGGNLADRLGTFMDDPKAAATLMAGAAEAVHHAHMRGILHRDLKPANILVDGDGQPHVTDFGLAKRVAADVEITASGAILGTPAYMSPEQAAGRRGAVTTATDVYGLGAILYALLTGKAPFGGDSVIETLDAVRTRAPESPTRKNRRVPRDLETICLKCLEKDPKRRYASAQSLADDLAAWLGSRPIAARRVGAAERAWLWCKRKPAVASLSAAVLFVLVGGTSTLILVQAKANADLRASNARESQRSDLAMEAIKTFHSGVSEDLMLKEKRFDQFRTRLLREAADFYGKLERLLRQQTDHASRAALGRAYHELAVLTEQIDNKSEALAVHRKALAIRRDLAAAPNASTVDRNDFARSLLALGPLQYETGDATGGQGSLEEALKLIQVSEAEKGASAGTHDLLAKCYRYLGQIALGAGRADEAIMFSEKALQVFHAMADAAPESIAIRREMALTYSNIATLHAQRGEPREALVSFERALEIRQQVNEDRPGQFGLQTDLALALIGVGRAQSMLGRSADALAMHEKARQLLLPLHNAYPGVRAIQGDLAYCENCIAILHADAGRTTEAVGFFKNVSRLRKALAESNPEFLPYQSDFGHSQGNLAQLLIWAGRPAEALSAYEMSVETLRRIADRASRFGQVQRGMAGSLREIGNLQRLLGSPGRSLKAYDEALKIQQGPLASAGASLPDYQDELAAIHTGKADTLMSLGRLEDARASCETAVALREPLTKRHGAAPTHVAGLSASLRRRGLVKLRMGDPPAAAADFRRAVELMEVESTLSPELRYDFACALATLSGLVGVPDTGVSAAEGEVQSERALAQLRRSVEMGYRNLPAIKAEPAFASLRDRPDFQLLLLDLVMPSDPFAP